MASNSGGPTSPSFRTGFTSDYVPGSINIITPLTSGGFAGCMVLVPATPPPGTDYNSYYYVLAYLHEDAGPTAVELPNIEGILLVDLPQGLDTPLATIAAAIPANLSPGPPSGVGGT
jgi:hypothetical protein